MSESLALSDSKCSDQQIGEELISLFDTLSTSLLCQFLDQDAKLHISLEGNCE